MRFSYSAYHTGLHIHLLQIIYCCNAYNTIDTTLHRVIKYFLRLVKCSPSRKMFHTKVVDLNQIYVSGETIFLYNKPLMRHTIKSYLEFVFSKVNIQWIPKN